MVTNTLIMADVRSSLCVNGLATNQVVTHASSRWISDGLVEISHLDEDGGRLCPHVDTIPMAKRVWRRRETRHV